MCSKLAKRIWADQHPVSKPLQSQTSLLLADVCDQMLHPPITATLHSGYSKLAYAQHTLSASDWLWSEHRRILPAVFADIEALSGRTSTLDAAASDSGDNAHCTSPSKLFMSQQHVSHIWINAPFTQLTAFVQHDMHCKQLSPENTSACSWLLVACFETLAVRHAPAQTKALPF